MYGCKEDVMDAAQSTEIINAIGSVGFPIVACGALFWMINTTMKELKQAIDQLSDAINSIKGE